MIFMKSKNTCNCIYKLTSLGWIGTCLSLAASGCLLVYFFSVCHFAILKPSWKEASCILIINSCAGKKTVKTRWDHKAIVKKAADLQNQRFLV